MCTFRSMIAVCIAIQCTLLNRSSYGFDCYKCSGIQNLTDCHNVVQCKTNEICSTDSYDSGGKFANYTLGCRLKQTCLADHSLPTASPVGIIGRSVTSTRKCSRCCEKDACNKELCIHGRWSTWLSWTSCPVTCGSGNRTRTRSCNNPAPTGGGLPCVGYSSQHTTCAPNACPVHGQWTRWAAWGTCSVTCGIGLERRDRSCSNPYPGPDGDPCWGDARDDRACFVRACSDGNWSTWSRWGSCSASCLGGIQKRTRTCSNPSPSQFGHDCVGNSMDAQSCNKQYCNETDGMWSNWSSWSSCTSKFVRKRTRQCNNPSPSHHGLNCAGSNVDIDVCVDALLGKHVRLVNGRNPYQGRLEVFYNGWGTVCDDGFDNEDAQVVCRMLGFDASQAIAKNNAYFGRGTLPIKLDDLHCTGLEASIFDCSHFSWEHDNCGHDEDAGVICAAHIRLVGGTSHSGRVEVKHDGIWGTVCNDYFNHNAAVVVCRSLGLPTTRVTYSSNSNHGSGYILLDDVMCTGVETSLEECQHSPWRNENCNHNEDVSVSCR